MRLSKTLAGLITAAGFCILALCVPHSASASPNAPIAVIEGGATGLNYAWGVSTDSTGNIYVANDPGGANNILIFAPAANGNVAPIGAIEGDNTGLTAPWDVELDAAGNVYVADDSGILVFAAGSSGNVAPIRHISGFQAYGLALGRNGLIYATLHNTAPIGTGGDVVVFAADANGAATPLKVFAGGGDSVDVAVDPDGNIYLSNYADSSIDIWSATATSGADPDRIISGDATSLNDPYGIDVDCAVGPLFISLDVNSNIQEFQTTDSGDATPSIFADNLPPGLYGLGLGQKSNLYLTTNGEGSSIQVFPYTRQCPEVAPLPDTGINAAQSSTVASALTALAFGAVTLGIYLVARRRKRATQ